MLVTVWQQGDGRLCLTKGDSYFDSNPEEASPAVIRVAEDDPQGRRGYEYLGRVLTQWHEDGR